MAPPLRPVLNTRLEQVPAILLVDDDTTIRSTLARLLQGHGYRASVASNGAEAMRLLSGSLDHARPAGDALPDVILLDLQMPEMNGWAVLAELRRNDRLCSIPVVVLSAEPVNVRTVLDAGARAFIRKDADVVDELFDLLGALDELDERQ